VQVQEHRLVAPAQTQAQVLALQPAAMALEDADPWYNVLALLYYLGVC